MGLQRVWHDWTLSLLLLLYLKDDEIVPMFSSVQLLSHVRLFATPRTAAFQASLSITNSWSLLKLMSIESVMPSNNLIFCHPLLLPPSIFPSIRVFSNESALCIRWPKYWSFSFSISPSMNIQDWFPLGRTGWISLQFKGFSRAFSTVQKHQFFASGGQSTGASPSASVLPWIFRTDFLRMDWFDLLAVQETLQESSPIPQFKSINSSVLSFLYSPTLTSIHDYRKNHSFD